MQNMIQTLPQLLPECPPLQLRPPPPLRPLAQLLLPPLPPQLPLLLPQRVTISRPPPVLRIPILWIDSVCPRV